MRPGEARPGCVCHVRSKLQEEPGGDEREADDAQERHGLKPAACPMCNVHVPRAELRVAARHGVVCVEDRIPVAVRLCVLPVDLAADDHNDAFRVGETMSFHGKNRELKLTVLNIIANTSYFVNTLVFTTSVIMAS